LIIDANVASNALRDPPRPEFVPICEALFSGSARMVHGGKLTDEYLRIGSIRSALSQLDRAGRVVVLIRAEVDAFERLLADAGVCESDDPHIIAIAQLSGARLLCSNDQDLHRDFTNKDLVDKPRGSVYQNESHKHLIRKYCG
jgi:hypothetical protein